MNRQPSISLIAAIDRNRVIGKDGGMPWHLPADLKHFKSHTLGKPVIMGRRTFESMGRPLKQRQNIIITRHAGYRAEGCDVAHAWDAALALAQGPAVMVIGGGEIYRLAMPWASHLIITEVDAAIEGGDTTFPLIDRERWQLVSKQARPADAQNAFAMCFIDYQRT